MTIKPKVALRLGLILVLLYLLGTVIAAEAQVRTGTVTVDGVSYDVNVGLDNYGGKHLQLSRGIIINTMPEISTEPLPLRTFSPLYITESTIHHQDSLIVNQRFNMLWNTIYRMHKALNVDDPEYIAIRKDAIRFSKRDNLINNNYIEISIWDKKGKKPQILMY